MNDKTKNQLTLLALILLFVIPMLLSTVLYRAGWQPHGKDNHGMLVDPPHPLENFSLEILGKHPFEFNQLKGKWTLLTTVSGDCLKPCQDNLYKIRQARLSLAQRMERVQRVLLIKELTALSNLNQLKQEYEGTFFLTGQTPLTLLLQTLADHTTTAADNIYVIDPLGNLVLYYPADAEPKGMIEDLKLLLRLSKIG